MEVCETLELFYNYKSASMQLGLHIAKLFGNMRKWIAFLATVFEFPLRMFIDHIVQYKATHPVRDGNEKMVNYEKTLIITNATLVN